ncbi:MAG: hypothetical protein H0U70_12140 [Tatlockia sp.]|nr:hypothetical protein [Tatlockia sp.]
MQTPIEIDNQAKQLGSKELIIRNQLIPPEIVLVIVSFIMKTSKASEFYSTVFSLSTANYALNQIISTISYLQPERLKIKQRQLRDLQIPAITKEYESVFSSSAHECKNPYGLAIYMLGTYSSLFSNLTDANGFAHRTEEKAKTVRFFKGQSRVHAQTVNKILLSHYNQEANGSRAFLFGEVCDLKKLLNELKIELIKDKIPLKINGALAKIINDVQILCKINYIDVIALSEEISPKQNSINGL